MEAQALVSRHVVKHLQEAVEGQANQTKANRHGDDVRNVIADGGLNSKLFNVIWRQEYAVYQEPEVHHTCSRLVSTEEPERLEVVVTYAVSDPGAMMVHLEHTSAAIAAVVRALRLPSLALIAQVAVSVRQILSL